MIAPSANSFLVGSALGAASMLSVGPNNLLMIREGLHRGRVVVVPSVVMFCFAGLILSALGFSDQITKCPTTARTLLAWLGVPTLMYFSIRCFISALNSRKVSVGSITCGERIETCILRSVAVILCNPLTYIELLIVPASICATMSNQADRLAFVSSLIFTSSIYCFGLAFGARYLIGILRSSQNLAFFDIGSGAVLFCLSLVMMLNLSLSLG